MKNGEGGHYAHKIHTDASHNTLHPPRLEPNRVMKAINQHRGQRHKEESGKIVEEAAFQDQERADSDNT